MIKKNAFLSALVLALFGLTLTSCWDEENPTTVPLNTTTTTMYSATLNGANEKPTSTTSPATGTFMGSLNSSTRVLSYTVTYSGFPASSTVTGGHLHRITNADGTGPINVPFPTLVSPIISTATLRQSQVDSLNAGQMYANIHTNVYPNGAIRGDIRRQ
jgi:hypothetical protein